MNERGHAPMIDIEDVPGRSMPPAARARSLQLVTVIHHGERRRRRQRRSFGVAAVLATTVAATTGGVAVADHLLKPAPVTNKGMAHCSAVAKLSSGNTYAGPEIAFAPANGNGPVPIQNAIAACSLPWRDGILRAGSTRQHTPDGKTHPVPHLVGCTLMDGSAAVFPGNAETCQRLGLPPIAN